MKKVLSLSVVFMMIFGLILAGWNQGILKVSASGGFLPTLPDFQKLSMDGAKEAGLNEEPLLKGKELKGYNGKSYIKPENQNAIIPLDQRGTDRKGIAILVDFPVENKDGKPSDVPYVTWEKPVPMRLFNDLLNGNSYDPYNDSEFTLFSGLKKWINPYSGKYEVYTPPTDSTLKNYYDEVSYGRFGISVDTTEWLTLPHSYDYYLGQGKPYYNETGDAHMFELISDAIDAAAAAGYDFSKYAVTAQPGDFGTLYGDDRTEITDKDGNKVSKIVPNIFIIHRGTGAEYGGRPELIWSHKWDLISSTYYGKYYQTGQFPSDSELSYKVVNGVVVNTYNICPEVGGWLYIKGYTPNPPQVGVFAHEFGHVLGLPDQYDYGYESNGTGYYSLMASGASGRTIPTSKFNDTSPVHMDAWSKIYLGFIRPDEIKLVNGNSKDITLRPLSQSTDVVKIEVPGSNGREYFLLSNRQQIGFDKGLDFSYYYSSAGKYQLEDLSGIHGLLVYHVVDDMILKRFNRPNEAENWDPNHRGLEHFLNPKYGQTHYGFSIIQADGRYDLEHAYNEGDAGDLFPGTNNITSINTKGNVSPNTTSVLQWIPGTSETGIVIENIKENEDKTVTFDVRFIK